MKVWSINIHNPFSGHHPVEAWYYSGKIIESEDSSTLLFEVNYGPGTENWREIFKEQSLMSAQMCFADKAPSLIKHFNSNLIENWNEVTEINEINRIVRNVERIESKLAGNELLGVQP
ncbi:hypothetical protein [Paenibacillus taichungensis]